MEDFDRTPFKNRDINRLTSSTTPPPGTSATMSFKNARDARNGNTSQQRAKAASEERSAEYINLLKEKTKKPPRNTGREYEPKVRKRHMKP